MNGIHAKAKRKKKCFNLRIIQEYFQPKIGRKKKNIQPGPEKNNILIKKTKQYNLRHLYNL